MVSDLKIEDIIQKLSLVVYLEEKCRICERFEISNSLANLKEIYKMLKLPKETFKIEIFRFKRYEATDHIDDLKLCENYLNFCVEFEYKFAPAILIRICYRNKCLDTIKITGNDYENNTKNLTDFLLKKITQSVSNFFN